MQERKAKRYLLLFRICSGLTILALIVSISTKVASSVLTGSAYESAMQISAATDTKQKITVYSEAIRLAPERPDAYILLISAYGEDGLFDKRESEEFLALYNANHNYLNPSDPSYGQLQKNIGFLYMNGYDDESPTRLRMAMPFLREANEVLADDAPGKQAVSCYCKIGTYYEDYIWDASSVREVSQPVMEELITGIEETLDAFLEDTSPDALFNRLGFDVAVCNLLLDQRNVLAVTIPQERVMSILDDIYSRLPSMESLQKEQTRQLLQTLEDNKELYYDMILRAYTRKGN